MGSTSPALWERCLNSIREIVSAEKFRTWFEPIEFVEYEEQRLKIRVRNRLVREFLQENYMDLIDKAVRDSFGTGVALVWEEMQPAPQAKWETFKEQVRKETGEQIFRTWFDSLELAEQNGQTLKIRVPNKVVLKYLLENHSQTIRQALHNSFGAGTVVVWENKETAPAHNNENKKTTAKATASNLDPHLYPDYTFENFVEGESNKLLHSVGISIAQNPNQETFNPLFIYGASGVGKTHLASAIGNRIKALNPQKRVLYISAHHFMVQYTDHVTRNKTNDFILFYQTIDVLIIDDIQELAGRTKTQQAFFHIFNHLHLNKRQLILTCDRPPVELEGLEDRLLTRFKWGLTAELGKPNIALRVAILRDKIKRDNLNFPEEVIQYIANNVDNSVRDLQGIINSMLAHSLYDDCEITLELAERVVARSVNIYKKEITIDLILERVCKHFNKTRKEVLSKSRKQDLVQVRQITMYLAQKHTGLSYARIGNFMGKRDHSTVLHACSQIEKRISVDKNFRREMEEIESSLLDS